jgi:hypothetical protein
MRSIAGCVGGAGTVPTEGKSRSGELSPRNQGKENSPKQPQNRGQNSPKTGGQEQPGSGLRPAHKVPPNNRLTKAKKQGVRTAVHHQGFAPIPRHPKNRAAGCFDPLLTAQAPIAARFAHHQANAQHCGMCGRCWNSADRGEISLRRAFTEKPRKEPHFFLANLSKFLG